MNWHLIVDVLPLLAEGALLTAQLTVISVLFGLVIALPLSLMRASTVTALSRPVLLYTFAFRGTPLLVQLFLIYYGVSQIEWIRSSFAWAILREPFWCALIAFSLNNAAYTTEILRGGILAVLRGEIEAAKALGMPYMLRTRRVVLPIAFRLSLPAYVNEVVLMLKASSLASTITMMELTGTARKIVAQTFSPYEVFISAAMIYLGFTFVVVHLFGRLERHITVHQRRVQAENDNREIAQNSQEKLAIGKVAQ
ncbi:MULTISPECIES: ABC transporter permease [unclassified Shinella]|uniref:ABC transporter permease n=1 Tax=unclassified Shinella TaxID=2643062 RepID=UPI00225C492E|nr:ABC transporter permease [Shinella sp. YE25]MDC7259828.1 ABC transporter permease [Shinella sp. YE25]CAI0333990.1 lysine/arginine/ornithine ABC transporter/histidine ABC transporter, membrane subunit HisM [Rhizobiaceae bacterium]CAK7261636.1 lysine/arginine/ornithine ABC transporter/histidine ABC transporter, membrane subunit HisM [Shinella sp. WSC3-e]